MYNAYNIKQYYFTDTLTENVKQKFICSCYY